MTSNFHLFMIFIAKISKLSSRAMMTSTPEEENQIKMEALEIRNEVGLWWQSCPPGLRDQRTDWRRQPRERKLTVPETLEEEAFSSTKACMYGCVMFIYHIINPLGLEPQSAEIPEAIKDVLEIAEETPEGYGLEMGLYYGLFAVGITVVNNYTIEEVVRRKLKADTRIALYVGFLLAHHIPIMLILQHADRALELLEVLWRRQHQYNRKFDWREVQKQMDIHMYARTATVSISLRTNSFTDLFWYERIERTSFVYPFSAYSTNFGCEFCHFEWIGLLRAIHTLDALCICLSCSFVRMRELC
jgi:hypothetical protein